MGNRQFTLDPLAAALARKAANGARGNIPETTLATGKGWRVQDIVCTCGPGDHDAEELTGASSVALVLSGSFIVRDQHGTSLLSEGSYLLVMRAIALPARTAMARATAASRSGSNLSCSSASPMMPGRNRRLRTTACRRCAISPA